MLREAFYWIINMSIIASAFGILIYFLRFMKGFPKFGCYVLWIVVLLRLLCPFGVGSSFSLLSLLNKASQRPLVRTVPVDANLQLSVTNAIKAAADYKPFTLKTSLLEAFFGIGSVIWMIITMAAIIAMLAMYSMTKAELKKAERLRDNIYVGSMVSTPTVYGIIRPKIVLPEGIEKEQIEYILAHERVHIRRHDNVWRMIAILTACIHWFNPIIWWLLKTFLEDMETACDMAVIKGMGEGERKSYARTLLSFAQQKQTMFASAFGSSKVKLRIENILTYKRLTLFSTVCFVLMCISVAAILLTNAPQHP